MKHLAINITSDYAIRTILYLANERGRDKVSGKEICDEMKIPYNYFLKIIPLLKDAELLSSFQGKKGGYTLQKAPEDISLYDVLAAMNDPIIIAQCLTDGSTCSRNATSHCAVHNLFGNIQAHIDKALKQTTMATIINEELSLK